MSADRFLSPLETVVAEAIARSRHYDGLAAVDTVDDGEPEEIRQVARTIAAALAEDAESGAKLRAQLMAFCASSEKFQGANAWVPTFALRHLIARPEQADG